MTLDLNFLILPTTAKAPLPPDWRLLVGLFAAVVTAAIICR